MRLSQVCSLQPVPHAVHGLLPDHTTLLSICSLDLRKLMHLYKAKMESTAGYSKPLPAANFLQLFSHLVRQVKGTAISLCLKHYSLLTKE